MKYIRKPRFKPHIYDDAVLGGHCNDIDNRSTQRQGHNKITDSNMLYYKMSDKVPLGA